MLFGVWYNFCSLRCFIVKHTTPCSNIFVAINSGTSCTIGTPRKTSVAIAKHWIWWQKRIESQKCRAVVRICVGRVGIERWSGRVREECGLFLLGAWDFIETLQFSWQKNTASWTIKAQARWSQIWKNQQENVQHAQATTSVQSLT